VLRDRPPLRHVDEVMSRYLRAPPGVVGDPLRMLDVVEQRTLSKATSAAGGYLVPQEMASAIVAARSAASSIGALAQELVTLSGRALAVPSVSSQGVAAWAAENASFTLSDDAFGTQTLNAFKASASEAMSEELVEDLGDGFEEYLAAALGRRLAVLEETAFAAGDGTGKPLGIANASSGYTVVTAATGSSTGFKWADLVSAVDALGPQYRPNASWIFSPSALTSILKLVDTAGQPLYTGGPLLGLPVSVSAGFPASAASARSAALGDWQSAYVVRRVKEDLGVQRQQEIYSLNGQLGYRVFERVDGRPTLLEAALILRHSAT